MKKDILLLPLLRNITKLLGTINNSCVWRFFFYCDYTPVKTNTVGEGEVISNKIYFVTLEQD